MSAIKDLIEQIDNPELRDRIQQEVDRISKQKKFGLVFEEHLPENVNLYDVPVRRGKRVSFRNPADGEKNKVWTVLKVDNDTAICISGEEKEPEAIPVKDLVVVAEFGEPIYPFLNPLETVCNAPDSDLWHTLIEADNYHALQLLEYLSLGRSIVFILIRPITQVLVIGNTITIMSIVPMLIGIANGYPSCNVVLT